jgi:hypothetical protein
MKILDTAQEKYLDHMGNRRFPSCFESPDQFETWQEVESIAHTKPRALPCRDCTVAYHEEMVSAGRCAVAGVSGVK